MSITLKNKELYTHEQARMGAMNSYPYGHPARFSVWEEYNIPVSGADECHLSEFVIVSIWNGLKDLGWPESTTMFPCSGMKRLALISFLERLQDSGCATASDVANQMGLSFGYEENQVVGFNTQEVHDGLSELIAFLYRNEEVYS